jgi:hypothetical protein
MILNQNYQKSDQRKITIFKDPCFCNPDCWPIKAKQKNPTPPIELRGKGVPATYSVAWDGGEGPIADSLVQAQLLLFAGNECYRLF